MVSQFTSSLSIKEIPDEKLFSGVFPRGIALKHVTFPFQSIELKPSDAYPYELLSNFCCSPPLIHEVHWVKLLPLRLTSVTP